MWGGGSQRIRVLSDAVRDLKQSLDSAVTVFRSSGKEMHIDGNATDAIRRVQMSVDNLARQLQVTNTHLSELARRPIVGMLGGNAEAELQRLTDATDALMKSIMEATAIGRQ